MKRLQVLEHVILCKDDQYNSFPSIVKRADGSFLLTFRRAPDWQSEYGYVTHIDPASFAAKLESADGKSWEQTPAVLYRDAACGVQDPRLNVLRDGTLLCTFFKWQVTEKGEPIPEGTFTQKVPGDRVGTMVGSFSIRSSDNGQTWDAPAPFPNKKVAIQGDCVELADGSLLALTYGHDKDGMSNVYVQKSWDKGLTWTEHAVIHSCDGYHFQEPNMHQTPSGKLVAFIRTAKTAKADPERPNAPLYTAESLDGGLTWSHPVPRAHYSPSPFHVLDLGQDGVFVSYGYRYDPFGIRAFLLNPECDNWDEVEEHVIRADGGGVDIGYTSAVQLHDGTILLLYYYFDQPGGSRYIAGTVCSVTAS